ncbi:hypothetical protein bpr_III187 [Butyrivibrio proteoclasticus B316]|uniref:Uncharacterized protein n=1 Tax=Butyrivibrio proteoclasticus (strain ATCC 51982 / DSM 14932 / B316) TaxID=515622 RepID=E0S391_BUTPB|nr:hypothetical protein bpr_III187 [Butyrivibrio proteoclasticus B316]
MQSRYLENAYQIPNVVPYHHLIKHRFVVLHCFPGELANTSARPISFVTSSLLMYFQRKPVRVTEKRHFFTRESIPSYRFTRDTHRLQFCDGLIYTIYTESKMTQSVSFGRRTEWMILHNKKFNFAVIELKVNLPIIPFRSIVLSQNSKAKLIMVKVQSSVFVGTNHRNMMNAI